MKLQDTRQKLLLSLFLAFVFALTMYPTKAHAQIIDQLDVNIPFQFHAGNTKFPAGKYIIKLLDDSDQTIMEIRSANDSTSALLEVQATQAKSTPVFSNHVYPIIDLASGGSTMA